MMPKPGFVIAVGTCSCSQGFFKDSYNTGAPLDNILPVDVYIPGCPPRPEAIIAGVVKMVEKMSKRKE
jgi:ech hydrogenase subunit C/membrane-bound hydrogenase subunit mbhJ